MQRSQFRQFADQDGADGFAYPDGGQEFFLPRLERWVLVDVLLDGLLDDGQFFTDIADGSIDGLANDVQIRMFAVIAQLSALIDQLPATGDQLSKHGADFTALIQQGDMNARGKLRQELCIEP